MESNTTFKLKCPWMLPICIYLILGLASINAQIIYTDIEPDFTGNNNGGFYNLDLNNDGTVDYFLESIYPDAIFINLIRNGNTAAVTSGPFWPIIKFLEENTIIANPQDYYDAECLYFLYNSVTNKYLGLKFYINGLIHYGWARMDFVGATQQWVIKDYAYQATPNTRILAGQGATLGINNTNGLKDIKIVSSNKMIAVFNLNETVHYKLYAITGQKSLEGLMSKESNSINAILLSKGFYVMELTNPQTGQTIKKKLIL